MDVFDPSNEQLEQLLSRLRAGDRAARDELLRVMSLRLERLARRMLNDFPMVRQFDDTFDVLQSSLVRLLRALETVRPESVRAFIGLAAEQIRRELLDLARRYRGPAVQTVRGRSSEETGIDPPDALTDPADIQRWCDFHEAVERLPPNEREVVGLLYYHEWTQARIAELFQVNERTVRRWWRSACLRLNRELKGDLPAFGRGRGAIR